MPTPRHSRPLGRAFALRAALALTLGAAISCYNDPQRQMDQMQQILDLGDILGELEQRTAEMQFTLDSLRTVVARQDTVVSRLANLAGVPR